MGAGAHAQRSADERIDDAQQLKVHPFRVKKAHEAVARLNSERLLEILNDLAELDQRFKSGTLDRRLGFEMFNQSRALKRKSLKSPEKQSELECFHTLKE